ncbi:hypothetical protein CH259_09095 [Rhodococcus sp. 05-2254-4]|nr:hypothetical protein CH259_09095 [Rhodococcus sp. 05-2254-4]OZE44847.1 hypothetical protein CH261_14800 [Rhodococcus sp. 05-2254-3]OZE45221.1 hypothetical protein CH283_22725 [Rhodococcus sp. 05-2254-2]
MVRRIFMHDPFDGREVVVPVAIVLNETYEESVTTFLSANEWVDDSEAPLVTSLIHVARSLDVKTAKGQALPAGLTMEFRMLFVELRKLKPADPAGAEKADAFDAGLAKILGFDTP